MLLAMYHYREYQTSYRMMQMRNLEAVRINHVKSEPERIGALGQCGTSNMSIVAPPGFDVRPRDQESLSELSSAYQRGSNILDLRQCPVEDTSYSGSRICPAPLCQQFWKAGDYSDSLASDSRVQNSKNHMHVHPKFLHSNATSHKWAFGAIAELLDNGIDEMQNGASFVSVDRILNPRDGSPSLLIQDDGGGMDPEAIRRCMSFGFSDKQSKSSIGKYGNGFKTSTMRLGADVIVFSRHIGDRTLTQSIGLLSYTYLTRTGLDRIVVPLVDYEYNMSTDSFVPLNRYGGDHFKANLSIILGWSPYTTIAELMKQFDDLGSHGTKVIVFNLWYTSDGTLELDFESDPEDIRLQGSESSNKMNSYSLLREQHIGNQYRYSLRKYMSILYLRIPQNFSIILRGVVVEHHSIARDLKYPEFIMYRPQAGGSKEGEILTTIGFLKEAPDINIHGFNVYHKNRLILPFWQVVTYKVSRGRGVVGLLEADFIEPTHNKQDFEKTSLFMKLEARLKDMTWEYWDYHCGLIGYQVLKKNRAPPSSVASSHVSPISTPEHLTGRNSNLGLASTHETDRMVNLPDKPIVQDAHRSIPQLGIKRTEDDLLSALGKGLRQRKDCSSATSDGHRREIQSGLPIAKVRNQQEAVALMKENKKLLEKSFEHEKAEEELKERVSRLRKELEEARQEFLRMLHELQSFDAVDTETILDSNYHILGKEPASNQQHIQWCDAASFGNSSPGRLR